MANPTNPHVEQKLLICALQTRDPTIRGKILSGADVEDFGTEYGILCRKRMTTLLSMGKALGDALAFGADPALTKGAKDWISGTPQQRQASERFRHDEIDSYLRTLKMHRNVRRIYEAQQDINQIAIGELDEDGVNNIESIMESTLMGIREGFEKQPILHIGKRQLGEEARALFERVITYDPKRFVATGQIGLDQHLYGWEKGNLVTISAPRAGGKSTMALSMAANQYLGANLNVCFVSMEMTEDELVKRLLSKISHVPHADIRYTKELRDEKRLLLQRKFQQFFRHGHNSNCNFSIWDVKDSFFTPMKMEASLAPYMYDVIYIDYITLFHSDMMDTWKMQLEYSRYLKTMAKRLNCVIVVLTQLSDEERVKYGKGIEENTDYWLWWRYREDQEQETNQGELRLDKARHAAKRRFPMTFLFEKMDILTELGDGRPVLAANREKQEVEGFMTNASPGWPNAA
jgi:replicative DNA helicase